MHKTMYLDMFSCEAKKNVQTKRRDDPEMHNVPYFW